MPRLLQIAAIYFRRVNRQGFTVTDATHVIVRDFHAAGQMAASEYFSHAADAINQSAFGPEFSLFHFFSLPAMRFALRRAFSLSIQTRHFIPARVSSILQFSIPHFTHFAVISVPPFGFLFVYARQNGINRRLLSYCHILFVRYIAPTFCLFSDRSFFLLRAQGVLKTFPLFLNP